MCDPAITPSGSQKPKPDWVFLLSGCVAWAWVAGIAWLYIDTYPPRFALWKDAAAGWEGPWRFPSEAIGALTLLAAVGAVAWFFGRQIGGRIGLWNGGEESAAEHAAATLGGLAVVAMGVFSLGCVGLLTPTALAGLVVVLLLIASGLKILSPNKPAPTRDTDNLLTSSTVGDSAGDGQQSAIRNSQSAMNRQLDGSASEDARAPNGNPQSSIPNPQCPRPTPYTLYSSLLLSALALCVSLLACLAPAVESDGMRYHLFGPQEYLRAHRLHYIPYSAFTNFPFLIEMLFTLGLGLSGDVAAKLFHWIHLPISAALLGELARRMTGGPADRGRLAGALAATLFLCAPVAAIVAGWSFIDLGIVAHTLAAAWFLARWLTAGRRRRDLLAAGFLAGAAVGTKYTCLALAGFAGITLLIAGAVGLGERLRRLILFSVAAALCSGPWFVKNVVLTGNPVYPLAYGLFGGGDWSMEAARFYGEKTTEKGFRLPDPPDFLPAAIGRPARAAYNLAAAPFDTAMAWGAFENQNPGPGYLLIFPLVLVWFVGHWKERSGGAAADGDESARRVTVLFVGALTAFFGVILFVGYPSNRFLLPVWALAAAFGGAFAARAPANQVARPRLISPQCAVYSAIIFASIVGLHWTSRYLSAEQNPRPFPAALGFDDRSTYMRKALNYHDCVEWLRLEARPGESALYVGEHRGYPSAVPARVSDWYDTPYILALIRQSPDNEALFDLLLSGKTRYVLLNFGELRLYEARYFRPRFTEAEWARFRAFVESPRLRRRWPLEGPTFVAEIQERPAHDAQAAGKAAAGPKTAP